MYVKENNVLQVVILGNIYKSICTIYYQINIRKVLVALGKIRGYGKNAEWKGTILSQAPKSDHIIIRLDMEKVQRLDGCGLLS